MALTTSQTVPPEGKISDGIGSGELPSALLAGKG